MAVVPRITVPSTQVRALPGGQQSANIPAGRGARRAAETQATGEAISKFASVLAEGAFRLKSRQDSVARARGLDSHRGALRDGFNKEVLEGSDFVNEEALTQFTTMMNESTQKTLADHTGSTESRLALSQILIQENSKFTEAALARSLQTQAALINRQLSEYGAEQTNMASKAPDALAEIHRDIENRVAIYADNLTPDQSTTIEKALKEQTSVGAMETLLALGDVDKIEAALDAGVDFLSAPTIRQFRNRITVRRLEGERQAAIIVGRTTRLQKMGVDTSDPRVALAIEGINLPTAAKRVLTLTEKVVEFGAVKKAQGLPPPTLFEIQQLADIDEPSGEQRAAFFGEGRKGRASAFIAEAASDFGLGLMSTEDEAFFLESVSVTLQRDPDTNQPGFMSPITRRALELRGLAPEDFLEGGRLSRAVREQFRPGAPITPTGPAFAPTPGAPAEAVPGAAAPAAGAAAPAAEAPAAAAAAAPGAPAPSFAPTEAFPAGVDVGRVTLPGQEPAGPPAAAEGEIAIDPQATVVAQGLAARVAQTRATESEGGLVAPTPGPPDPRNTLFNLVSLVTGPFAGARQAIASTAIIGRILPAPEYQEARVFFDTWVLDFSNSLRRNPRFNEKERQDILDRIDLTAGFFDEPLGLQDTLIGLDDFLAQKEANAIKTLDARVSGLERQHTLNVLNHIKQARKEIGVPPRISSTEELQQRIQAGDLNPGQFFRDNAGQIWRVKPQDVPTPAGTP